MGLAHTIRLKSCGRCYNAAAADGVATAESISESTTCSLTSWEMVLSPGVEKQQWAFNTCLVTYTGCLCLLICVAVAVFRVRAVCLSPRCCPRRR